MDRIKPNIGVVGRSKSAWIPFLAEMLMTMVMEIRYSDEFIE